MLGLEAREDSTTEESQAPSTAPPPQATATPEPTPEPRPAGEQPKATREDQIERFRPSEEVPADSAVSFPVDI